MASNVALIGCIAMPSGSHSSYSPTTSIECSPDTFGNGKGVVRKNDGYSAHSSGSSTHGRPVQGTTSTTVFVNGRGLARLGDQTDCGNTIAAGFSPDVFAG